MAKGNNNNNNKATNGKVMNSQHAKSEVNALPPQKSVFIAYILWLFGGLFGIHHLYLHRDRHAFLWWCSLGGYFGIGWIGEIFTIPSYVRDANEDPRFIEEFIKKLQTHKKPPYSGKRFLFEIMIGYLFGQLFHMAIPNHLIMEVDFNFLHWLIPLFVAIGVWTVGNIGREHGVLWHCLLAAFAAYPIRYFIYDETYTILITSLVAALVFDHASKEWLRTPPKRRGICERFFKFSTAMFIYFSLWGCFFYFNGTIPDENGNEVPIHEAFQNFLASAWWTDIKQALKDMYTYAQHHGWYEIWKELLESMDVDGERNAYKVLGLSATASQSEITTTYRKLCKTIHPDTVKDESQRAAAQQRFIEVQQAYEILSKIKSARIRKNKKVVNDDDIENDTIVL